ncbi:hypothetical protein [Hyphomicrobium sp. CS1BSMeth3]|uniref:hypothetical protein n=1 Tax=Hyphomicrobium sp. CS1BSMeth3 TaxID=1892844 RepID=UPI0009310F82|nr:hypothetical protein [Hyphomicrobium sp. CS1BSMeth3]
MMLRAIGNVLEGRNAEGTATINTRVPYPRAQARSKVRAAFILTELVSRLEATYQPHHLTWLTVKFLAHLAKSYTHSLALRAEYPTKCIAEALQARPELIGSRIGFATLLDRHYANRPTALTEAAKRPLSPRRVLWRDAAFSLTEMTHPRHLREDGFALHHCTGAHMNPEILAKLERAPTPREAPFALDYWQGIQSGRVRMLTLMENNHPRVTIQYICASHNINQAQALEPLTQDSRLLAPLCRALAHFRAADRLINISALPPARNPRACLTIDGTYENPTPTNLHRILAGHIDVPPDISWPELQFLCRIPHVTLNLTRAPSQHINRITEVAGHIAMRNHTARLVRLRHVTGHLRCSKARTISTPNLITIGGSNYCDSALTVLQPRLATIGASNYCDSVQLIHQPALTSVGKTNIVASGAQPLHPKSARPQSSLQPA